uniref:Uncharacterized protein n=1 Tax=Arundo donax TaxID=35708 RepID=A0A0A8YZ45_ARUDO
MSKIQMSSMSLCRHIKMSTDAYA